MGGLHRVEDRGAQLGADRLEVDLVAQPRAEGLERLRGVVAVAVEAPVDGVLDAGTRRAEQRGHRERRDRDGEAGLADRQSHQQHESQVGRGERRRERAVDQRAVDDDVDVEEPVAQDRGAGREREHGEAERQHRVPQRADPRRRDEVADDVGDHRDARDRRGECQPLELRALDATGAAEPDRGGGGREADRRSHEDPSEPAQGVHQVERPRYPERVGDRGERIVERAWTQRVAEHVERDPGDGQPERGAPAARRQAAVGEEEQGDAEQAEGGRQAEVLEPRRGGPSGELAGRDVERAVGVLVHEVPHAQDRAGEAEDRPDRVAGHPRENERADGRERERGDRERHAAVAAEPERVGGRRVARSEREQDERGEHHRERAAPDEPRPHRPPSLSHSDTCAGCTLSRATPRSSAATASRST